MNSIHHIGALLRLLSCLKEGGRGGVRVKLSAPPQGLEFFFFFFFFFKFYVLMQPKAMKHDAIYLNSSTEALCVC